LLLWQHVPAGIEHGKATACKTGGGGVVSRFQYQMNSIAWSRFRSETARPPLQPKDFIAMRKDLAR
jgi:hypothetical protein